MTAIALSAGTLPAASCKSAAQARCSGGSLAGRTPCAPRLPLSARRACRAMVYAPERLQQQHVSEQQQEPASVEQQQQQQAAEADPLAAARQARAEARRREQVTYQVAAIAATGGITATAIAATYYRIMLHMADSQSFPVLDLACTLLLAAGAAFGMEMYARWVHKDMWHDNPTGWILHASHHEPRTGPFEANDLYALMNAVPAMALCAYGFLRPDVWGGVCFGAGLGITLFGISYMFVHDGLVHRRFPVGPIADLPAMKRIVVAHQLHHSEKYGGVPFGMFLGPQELEAVGAGPELDRLVAEFEASRKAKEAKREAEAAGRPWSAADLPGDHKRR